MNKTYKCIKHNYIIAKNNIKINNELFEKILDIPYNTEFMMYSYYYKINK